MTTFSLDDYEVVPPYLSQATAMIVELWVRSGCPSSPLSSSGRKLVDFVFSCYKELFPEDYSSWLKTMKEYKANELSVHEQVHKRTGRSLLSYPYWVFAVLKVVFPGFDFVKRENALKIAKLFPQFRIANKT